MTTYHIKCEEKTVWRGDVEADSFEEALNMANNQNICKSVFMSAHFMPIKCVEISERMPDGSLSNKNKVGDE
jgi:hypothetical protein